MIVVWFLVIAAIVAIPVVLIAFAVALIRGDVQR